jgi:hypothetical protein
MKVPPYICGRLTSIELYELPYILTSFTRSLPAAKHVPLRSRRLKLYPLAD